MVRVAHVRYLNLDPGFAVAWVNLRHAAEALAASETTSQIKTAMKKAERSGAISIADTTTGTTAHDRTSWRSEHARFARADRSKTVVMASDLRVSWNR